MPSVKTPFGILTVPSKTPKKSLYAEVRGLSLLSEILLNSQVWETRIVNHRMLIVSTDFQPQIVLDPLLTVHSYLTYSDQHLVISIDNEERCVLSNGEMQCAVADSLVSIILLGEACWPDEQTPTTLAEKAEAAIAYRELKKRDLAIEDYGIPLSLEGIAAFHRFEDEIIRLKASERLAAIGAYARELYVCHVLEVEGIQQHVTLLMKGISTNEILLYLEQPKEKADRIFIPAPSS